MSCPVCQLLCVTQICTSVYVIIVTIPSILKLVEVDDDCPLERKFTVG